MAANNGEDVQSQTQQLLLRADEVDAGTSIPTSDAQKPLSALTPVDGTASGTTRPKPPPRPVLRRDGTNPPPPPPSQPPPPAPPLNHFDNPTDSLSLPQLKQLVSQFPKAEQRLYAYQYRDAEDFATEIDEWFHYTESEQDREYLLFARESFEQQWRSFCEAALNTDDASWTQISHVHRDKFLSTLLSGLSAEDTTTRHEAIATVYYVLVGVWSVTAGIEGDHGEDENVKGKPQKHNSIQIEWMHNGADAVATAGLIPHVYHCLRKVLEQPQDDKKQASGEGVYDVYFDDSQYREISMCMSSLYLFVESGRSRQTCKEGSQIRAVLLALEPKILTYFVGVISRLRWDESYNIPLMHALQLLWKLILVCFGDLKEHLDKVKNILQPRVDPFSAEASRPILTASPLDYHLFRQEITSKYPAYNPPPPLVPLEIEQKTMLPPPPNPARQDPYEQFAHVNPTSTGGSILHQPVHIATPAPSPPPSPAGPGGKAGKKQNYQTNQNFPFLYPPLDSGSNNIGGKGSTEFQDTMVGRKWEGSDIPASIIEAGELFASRMRMTRGMKQLWKERDLFMKYDRGWNADLGFTQDLDQKPPQDNAEGGKGEDDLNDSDLQSRLRAVDDFFHHSLPDLQSLIIVMMKVMLTNVRDIAVRNGSPQDGQTNGIVRNKSNSNVAQSQALPMPPPPPLPEELPLDDLDNIRSQEISQKAISACLFLMLKWCKISHVLKFEYITQLLLDSNYVQLTLKYFAHQNLEDLVILPYDRNDLSFWHYCHLHSDHPPLSPTSPHSQPTSDNEGLNETSSPDDAVPPPIQRQRRSPTSNPELISSSAVFTSPEQSMVGMHELSSAIPMVDELGNPVGPVPQKPIEEFSARQFQTSIHLLRVLQKLTRSKAHRILLLVQFKSSQILRRILRVPDPTLRLYVLKLFKSQVPYCGRKWRQSNMRVITAIYLHCRPELRDEWLAGMHDSNVEGEVDEAVPLEWALRGLTYWWMKRTYPDVMKKKGLKNKSKDRLNEREKIYDDHSILTQGNIASDGRNLDQDTEGGQEVDDEERDFFQRELDAMGWGLAGMGLGAGEDVGFGEEAPGVVSAFPTGTASNGMNGDGPHSNQGWDNMHMNINTSMGTGSSVESWS